MMGANGETSPMHLAYGVNEIAAQENVNEQGDDDHAWTLAE